MLEPEPGSATATQPTPNQPETQDQQCCAYWSLLFPEYGNFAQQQTKHYPSATRRSAGRQPAYGRESGEADQTDRSGCFNAWLQVSMYLQAQSMTIVI